MPENRAIPGEQKAHQNIPAGVKIAPGGVSTGKAASLQKCRRMQGFLSVMRGARRCQYRAAQISLVRAGKRS
jgi:hypothetical protein